MLVIDDLRVLKTDWERHTDVTYARTPIQGIAELDAHAWDVVVLDHDMGMDYNTGDFLDIWPVIHYIEENHERLVDVDIWIVTSNPVAGERMRKALEGYYDDIWYLGEAEKRQMFTYLDW